MVGCYRLLLVSKIVILIVSLSVVKNFVNLSFLFKIRVAFIALKYQIAKQTCYEMDSFNDFQRIDVALQLMMGASLLILLKGIFGFILFNLRLPTIPSKLFPLEQNYKHYGYFFFFFFFWVSSCLIVCSCVSQREREVGVIVLGDSLMCVGERERRFTFKVSYQNCKINF